jgi:hypothetical protein
MKQDTSIKDLPFDQIEAWVKEETAKGRPPQEIMATLATRKDVGILRPGTPEQIHQQILETLQNH